jgi:hypothetical protein
MTQQSPIKTGTYVIINYSATPRLAVILGGSEIPPAYTVKLVNTPHKILDVDAKDVDKIIQSCPQFHIGQDVIAVYSSYKEVIRGKISHIFISYSPKYTYEITIPSGVRHTLTEEFITTDCSPKGNNDP